MERLQRRSCRGSALRPLRRLPRRDRTPDDGALRHAPRGTAPCGPGSRPFRLTTSRPARDRRRGRRERAPPARRRLCSRARRPRCRRPRLGLGLRRGPRPRSGGRGRSGAAGALRRLDDGRRWTGAHDRPLADRRHELARAVLDGAATRPRRSRADARRDGSPTNRSRRTLGRRRPQAASDRSPPGSDLRARRRRGKLGGDAARAAGSERDRCRSRRRSRAVHRNPHAPVRRGARRPGGRTAHRGRGAPRHLRRRAACWRSRDRSRCPRSGPSCSDCSPGSRSQ